MVLIGGAFPIPDLDNLYDLDRLPYMCYLVGDYPYREIVD